MHDKAIKKIFHDEGLQIGPVAVDCIQYEIARRVERMAKRVQKANIRRFQAKDMWVALGNYNSTWNAESK